MLNAFERMERLRVCRACADYPRCPQSQQLIDEAVGCPLNRWPMRGIGGAGDVVAFVAQPVAHAIDFVFGTDIAECKGCKARRDALNRMLPL